MLCYDRFQFPKCFLHFLIHSLMCIGPSRVLNTLSERLFEILYQRRVNDTKNKQETKDQDAPHNALSREISKCSSQNRPVSTRRPRRENSCSFMQSKPNSTSSLTGEKPQSTRKRLQVLLQVIPSRSKKMQAPIAAARLTPSLRLNKTCPLAAMLQQLS